MKFEIDTATKTLSLIGEIKFSDIDNLKKFIGKDWHKWTIKSTTTTYVNSPTWIPYYIPTYPYPRPYWYGGDLQIWCGTGSTSVDVSGNDISQLDLRISAEKPLCFSEGM